MYVEQLPSGRYRVSVRYAGHKRTTPSYDTEAEARLAGAELLLELGGTPQASLTVNELIDQHLATYPYQPTTKADLQSVVKRLRADNPPILAMKVRAVTALHVTTLYATLQRNGWSPHRLARLHGTLLSSAFATAYRYGWCRTIPTADVGPTPPEAADINPPTGEQVKRILAAANEDMYPLIKTAATIGARRGELVGLQWADINFGTGRLTIRRGMSATKDAGLHEGVGKTGSRGHRTVTMSKPLRETLETHRTRQAADAARRSLPSPVWVFSADGGVTPIRPDSVSQYYDRLLDQIHAVDTKAAAEAGLPPPERIDTTFHQLRHYVATSLLTAGVVPSIVAHMLGHSIDTLHRRYSHFIPGTDGGAADIMGNLVG